MISKKNIVDQILAGGKVLLNDAVAKATAVKQIKNKDAVRAWKNMFAQIGTISREETGVYVSPKTVVTVPVAAEVSAVVAPAPVTAVVPATVSTVVTTTQ